MWWLLDVMSRSYLQAESVGRKRPIADRYSERSALQLKRKHREKADPDPDRFTPKPASGDQLDLAFDGDNDEAPVQGVLFDDPAWTLRLWKLSDALAEEGYRLVVGDLAELSAEVQVQGKGEVGSHKPFAPMLCSRARSRALFDCGSSPTLLLRRGIGWSWATLPSCLSAPLR